MRKLLLATLALGLSPLFAADTEPPSVGQVLDRQFGNIEREMLPLAEAMPADKYNFAPTQGEFKGVRTFGQQISHTAAVIYSVCAAVLGEKNPSQEGENENGPASLKTKEDIVKYLKDAIAYGHKALQSVTNANATELIKTPFGSRPAARLSMANVAIWHSFDHYGQAVVYLRMNGLVPPASRPR